MYDLAIEPETPGFLAPRRRRLGVPERLDARGQVLVPLDEAACATPCGLRAQAVQAIAVCYLFSFVNPAHERRTREIVAERRPGSRVALARGRSDLPRVRAAVRDRVRRLPAAGDEALPGGATDTLRGLGVPGVPLTMQSRGGLVSAARAASSPSRSFSPARPAA